MKTPGQIAYENWQSEEIWSSPPSYEMESKYEKGRWENMAQAVLSSQWRSVDDPPDDPFEFVLVMGGTCKPITCPFRQRNSDRTHWMSIPAIPKPKELTPEEKALQEFKEKFVCKYDLTQLTLNKHQTFKFNSTENAWIGFKAAKGL